VCGCSGSAREKREKGVFVLLVLGFKALMALFVGQQAATGVELALKIYAKQLSTLTRS